MHEPEGPKRMHILDRFVLAFVCVSDFDGKTVIVDLRYGPVHP